MSYEEMLQVVKQYKELLYNKRKNSETPIRGQITVTGGEPFVRKDFMDLLEVFHENRRYFGFAILTNGSYLDKHMAKRLTELNPRFVQVSVEGTQKTHDGIRGKGDFEKTVSALKNLVRYNIRSSVSFTAHKGNFREFFEVAKIGRRLGVSQVWADRFIPYGSGTELSDQVLDHEETREFIRLMDYTRRKLKRTYLKKTEISLRRALQFLEGGGRPYSCSAGESLITIMPNGDLYPCRRMPIYAGNVLETPLKKLYYENPLLQSLRDGDRICEGCENCFYSKLCRGGLKCLSYALTNDQFQRDPGCWRDSSPGEVGCMSNRSKLLVIERT
jgi:radical SAM protein with 4Fe4S-binding SPASM domain